MLKLDLDEETAAVLRDALLAWRAEGVADPTIPIDDVTGDGIADAWALDENDDVVLRPGVAYADTVAESTGKDGF